MNPQDILVFWFGQDPSIIVNQKLWFEVKIQTDEKIKKDFELLLNAAENYELNHWCTDFEKGQLALVIILDQITKFINRGTPLMFKNESRAVELAYDIIKSNKINCLTPIERYFMYEALLNAENIEMTEKGLLGIRDLYNNAIDDHKGHFEKLLKKATNTFEILKKYGRFPQRNFLLDRSSTRDEQCFIKSNKFKFHNLYVPATQKNLKKKNVKPILESKLPFQRLLFLHGFRQNANKIKKRLNRLLNTLKVESNTHVTFLNGTHPYTEKTEENSDISLKNLIESQRVWYYSESSVYHGIEEAYDHVLDHIKRQPPYDGIIGFSQGGVLASIIIKKNPHLFRYFISLSSFAPRSMKYNDLYSVASTYAYPSLHIFGKTDQLVIPEKSIQFSQCFEASEIAEHSFGHFAPDNWPIEKICNFINKQAIDIKPIIFEENQSIETNIVKLELANFRFQLNELDLSPLLNSNEAKQVLISEKFINFFEEKNLLIFNGISFEDKIMLVYFLMKRASNESDESLVNDIWIEIYLEHTEKFMNELVIQKCFMNIQNWKKLVSLCDIAKQKELEDLYNHIIDKLFNQLIFDLSLYDKNEKKKVLISLTSIHKTGSEFFNSIKIQDKFKWNEENNKISYLPLHLPRIKNAVDKRSRIARELANLINSYKDEKNEKDLKEMKIISYNRYRQIVSCLSRFISKPSQSDNTRESLLLARHDKLILELLKIAPISDSIINPVPEPVDIASRKEMQPLYDWLKTKQAFDDSDLRFLKGVVTSDGRLDLCKQVIGPQGIVPLLDSLKERKEIDKILLGNNIIGDNAGQVIADFIKSGKSPIKVWYIAGNSLTSKGIKPIAEALSSDTFVTGLWLKRNPLKLKGMVSIGNLMSINKTITVLDLLNCGLLDSGTQILFESLKLNYTLKHLYLSANGISAAGLKYIHDYFKTGKSELNSLFLGCNRIGDEGSKIISEFIKFPNKLTRLNLASSRIGAEGMKYLSEALVEHGKIQVLDLGYMRSTMDMGELGNYIEDTGAEYLSKFLEKSNNIVSLNITHNHIKEYGFSKLVEALKKNKTLISLDYAQFGFSVSYGIRLELSEILEANRNQFLAEKSEKELNELMIPSHVAEIYSVYRTSNTLI